MNLADLALEYLDAAHAENTKSTYASAWSDFEFFCTSHHLTALPASPATVATYLTYLSQAQRMTTLHVKMSAIRDRHRRDSLEDPTADPRVRELFRGIRRKRGTPPNQKAAITRVELFAMVQALDEDIENGAISALRGTRNKALLVLCYAGMFRRSELAQLTVEDIEFRAKEMIITVRHSKTDQEGHGLRKHIPRLDDAGRHVQICPVRLLQAWLRLAKITDGPLFRAIDQFDHVRNNHIADRDVALFVKQAIERIGLDPKQFSAHSLKAGPITQGFADGFEEWEVQSASGHASRIVLQKYNRKKENAQARVVRGIFGQPPEKAAQEKA